MTIVDTKGNRIDTRLLGNPDYEKGRLLQNPENPDIFVYTTFEEVPYGEGYGETENSGN